MIFVFVLVFEVFVFVFVGRDQRVTRTKNSLGKYHICCVSENIWHGFLNVFGLVAFYKDVSLCIYKYKRICFNF